MDINNILPIVQGFAGGIVVAISMWRILKNRIERLEKDCDSIWKEVGKVKDATMSKDMCNAVRTQCKAKLELYDDMNGEIRDDIKQIKLDIKSISENLIRHLGQHDGGA